MGGVACITTASSHSTRTRTILRSIPSGTVSSGGRHSFSGFSGGGGGGSDDGDGDVDIDDHDRDGSDDCGGAPDAGWSGHRGGRAGDAPTSFHSRCAASTASSASSAVVASPCHALLSSPRSRLR